MLPLATPHTSLCPCGQGSPPWLTAHFLSHHLIPERRTQIRIHGTLFVPRVCNDTGATRTCTAATDHPRGAGAKGARPSCADLDINRAGAGTAGSPEGRAPRTRATRGGPAARRPRDGDRRRALLLPARTDLGGDLHSIKVRGVSGSCRIVERDPCQRRWHWRCDASSRPRVHAPGPKTVPKFTPSAKQRSADAEPAPEGGG